MEEWKDIVGFEGIYEISNHGQVRSKITNKIKKQTINKATKRPYLGLWVNNKQTIVKPHRLVLTAFIGKCPKGMEGCHNDGNPFNNHIDNLRWDTPKNNHADKVKHGTTNRGEKCAKAKLTIEQVNAIRQDNRLQKEIAKEYGVQQSLVSRIKNNVRWQHC
jgi:predicted XRE-type DNA-binding protein